MLCVMNCKTKNVWVLNSITDICIFQVRITVFKDFFYIRMIIFKAFQCLEHCYIKFQDFSYFSGSCMNPENRNILPSYGAKHISIGLP